MDITQIVKRNNFAPAQYERSSCCTAEIRALWFAGTPHAMARAMLHERGIESRRVTFPQ
jgi:hypothetical protein